MAHEIENEMFAYVGQPAWHGIGQECPVGADAKYLFMAAKLDWEVAKSPIWAKAADGTLIPVDGKNATLRSTDNKVMTICSDAWEPVQNSDVAAFMQQYADAGKATMECAGALRDGQIIWGLANLNHNFEIRPGDVTKSYLAMTSSHQVGVATKIRVTTTRIVCQNTMNIAERNSQAIYKQNHLGMFDFEAAKRAVAEAHELLSLQEKRLTQIDKLKLSIEDACLKVLIPAFAEDLMELSELEQREVIVSSQKMPKVLANIITSIYDAPGAIPDTGYGILQGITHFTTHVAGTSQSNRMYNTLVGNIGEKVKHAESLLLALTA